MPARPGADVRLTIDEVLQYIVEKELSAQVRRVGARRAIGVMVEPDSGRILALASVPGFNPNTYELYGASLWKEPAIQEFYEPGSTFKIVTAAAYLDAGESLSKKYFAENGSYRYGGGRYTLRDHKKYGWLTAEEVIMKSSTSALSRWRATSASTSSTLWRNASVLAERRDSLSRRSPGRAPLA